MIPTDAQKEIIDYDGNAVVSASPGSGKTFVLAQKIRRILESDDLQEYEGVIAISFTNKATSNLRSRVLDEGINIKNSHFATISSFCINQIIEPFANYIWGWRDRPEIIKIKELDPLSKDKFSWIEEHKPYSSISEKQFDELKDLYLNGRIIINSIEIIALHILKHCLACRNYLTARFRYVLIDEYQDADIYINELFLNLIHLGMKGIVVGDEQQAIFGFAHKSNKYLRELRVRKDFKSFYLNDNFRCTVPIINYSNRLLDSKSKIKDTDEEGMYLVRVKGDESKIAAYIDSNIDSIMKQWNVGEYSKVAILVRYKHIQDIVDKYLKHKHRVAMTSPLDEDINFSSKIYSDLLRYKFDTRLYFMQVIEEYQEYDDLKQYEKEEMEKIAEEIRLQPIASHKERLQLEKIFDRFIKIIFPEEKILDKSKELLIEVLSNPSWIDCYCPASEEEIAIMTLHKAKGLEFDMVFHLNLNEWELPSKRFNPEEQQYYPSYEEDKYLHYVGITRAKKACYLVQNSKRTNSSNQERTGNDSEFLSLNGLDKLRIDL